MKTRTEEAQKKVNLQFEVLLKSEQSVTKDCVTPLRGLQSQ